MGGEGDAVIILFKSVHVHQELSYHIVPGTPSAWSIIPDVKCMKIIYSEYLFQIYSRITLGRVLEEELYQRLIRGDL